MRLLHTSDWHLGRSLHHHSLIGAQSAFVDFLVDVVTEESIEAVLVAGDIYDRSIPPVDAVELFDDALSRLAALNVPVVLVSGNHDSAVRLRFGSDLIARAGIHLRTEFTPSTGPIVLDDGHGDVAIYPLPYLEPELSWLALDAKVPRHDAVLSAAMASVRGDLSRRPHGTRAVVMAHAFVGKAGSVEVSESERDISVGGTSLVPASVFDGAHYVALGHIHRCQQPVADRVVYSGSPIAYSFSEAAHTKSVTIVDLAADGAVSTEQIACPVVEPMAIIEASLDSLLTDSSWGRYERHLLAVTLTDAETPIEPMGRLRTRFPHVLQLTVRARRSALVGAYVQRLDGLDDLGLAKQFVNDMWSRPCDPTELELLESAFESIRITEAAR